MIDDFVVFILSYGRPNNVKTYKTLKRFGYTGKIYIICSTDDTLIADYQKKYKDEIILFNKENVKFDSADNFQDKRVIVYARNECFKIAENLGYKYFLQLDDDYTDFCYRFDDKYKYKNGRRYVKNLDDIFKAVLEFYKKIPAKSVAFSQNGDWIGGKDSSFAKKLKLKRKCMNSFFCSTDRPFKFLGRVNEDVNTYIRMGAVGNLFFTIPNISIKQTDTQTSKGGMSDIYLQSGTYIKSFYSVIFNPSSVKVNILNTKRSRLHHKVNWNNAVPKILNEEYKK